MEPGVLCFCNGGITAIVRFFGRLCSSFEVQHGAIVIFFCVLYHILYIVFYTLCYNESIKRWYKIGTRTVLYLTVFVHKRLHGYCRWSAVTVHMDVTKICKLINDQTQYLSFSWTITNYDWYYVWIDVPWNQQPDHWFIRLLILSKLELIIPHHIGSRNISYIPDL